MSSRLAVAVLFPGAIAYEIVSAIEVLARRLTVRLATPGGRDHEDESGLVYRAHLDFAAATREQPECLVIAGGDLAAIIDDQALFELIRGVDRRGGTLGAICAGPLALALAGVLRGHAYTQAGRYPASMQHVWDGAEFRTDPVVVDGNLVTALPEAQLDFAVEVGRRAGAYPDDAAAESHRSYLHGRRPRDWSLSGPVAGV